MHTTAVFLDVTARNLTCLRTRRHLRSWYRNTRFPLESPPGWRCTNTLGAVEWDLSKVCKRRGSWIAFGYSASGP